MVATRSSGCASIFYVRQWSGADRGGIPVSLQDPAGDRGLVDLVGAVVDPRGALVHVAVGEDRVVGDAERAVQLDRASTRCSITFADEELDQRDLLARGS